MLYKEESGQTSAELILLIAGIIMVVIIAATIYNDYLSDFANEINDTEVNNLKNKIDEINNLIKEVKINLLKIDLPNYVFR